MGLVVQDLANRTLATVMSWRREGKATVPMIVLKERMPGHEEGKRSVDNNGTGTLDEVWDEGLVRTSALATNLEPSVRRVWAGSLWDHGLNASRATPHIPSSYTFLIFVRFRS